MSFSNDPATAIGKVRLLIQDTNAQAPLFQDEELQYFLDQAGGDVNTAAVNSLRTLARRFAMKGKEQIGDYSYDWTAQGKTIAAMADALAEQLGLEGEDVVIGTVGGECFLSF